MVFTMALESDEALAAADAAGERRGSARCSSPTSTAATPASGWWPRSSSRASCPGGCRPSPCAATRRATIGTGRARDRRGPVGRGRAPRRARPAHRPRSSWPASTGRCSRTSSSAAAPARIAAQLREVTEPGRLADVAGYSPDLSLAQKVEVLETLDVEDRLRLVLGWARETLADLTLRERIKTDVEEGMEQTQREFLLRRQLESIRKELGRAERRRRRPTPTTTARRSRSGTCPTQVRSAVLREVDKLERTSDQSPETGWIRTWLDTVLEVPWGVESEDRLDVSRGGADPRRGPRRAGGREGAHPRAPGGAQAPGRARPDTGRRPGRGGHPGPGRSARCRQDVARRVRRPSTRPAIRPRVARGRA